MERIIKLPEGSIFCFGSNLSGRHGAGAALDAVKYFGAFYGQGEGLQGGSYAIPTKSHLLKVLKLPEIKSYIERFLSVAALSPLRFVVTEIGCGLAGYKPSDIAPMFLGHSENVILPDSFKEVLPPTDSDSWHPIIVTDKKQQTCCHNKQFTAQ